MSSACTPATAALPRADDRAARTPRVRAPVLTFLAFLFAAFAARDLFVACSMAREGPVVAEEIVLSAFQESAFVALHSLLAALLFANSVLSLLFAGAAWRVESWARKAGAVAASVNVLCVTVGTFYLDDFAPGAGRLVLSAGTMVLLLHPGSVLLFDEPPPAGGPGTGTRVRPPGRQAGKAASSRSMNSKRSPKPV